MEPVSVSYCRPTTERVITCDGMLSVRIVIIQDKNLWGVIRGGQLTNRVSRGNRNVIWKCIRGLSGYFVWAWTIINGNGRFIQIFTNTINRKGIIEAVIYCNISVLSH